MSLYYYTGKIASIEIFSKKENTRIWNDSLWKKIVVKIGWLISHRFSFYELNTLAMMGL